MTYRINRNRGRRTRALVLTSTRLALLSALGVAQTAQAQPTNDTVMATTQR